MLSRVVISQLRLKALTFGTFDNDQCDKATFLGLTKLIFLNSFIEIMRREPSWGG